MSNLPLAGNALSNDQKVAGFYDGYYAKNIPVSGQEYDAVMAFFLKKTAGNKLASEALTSSIMVIAQNRNINAIGIIEQFKSLTNDNSFKAALIALLNSDRRATSKLGYALVPEPNPYVVRNISG